MSAALEIVTPGWASTVQDLGRPGYATIGVGRSGALDVASMSLANRLVGNPVGAAVIETAGELVVRAMSPMSVAVVGSPTQHAAPMVLAAHDVVRVAAAGDHLWSYLAVRGGIGVAPVLGSRSRDTLAHLGPPDLVAGAVLPIGPDPRTPIVADVAPRRPPAGPIRLWPGPRREWFAASALELLVTTTWRVGADVSRVGARLEGPALGRAAAASVGGELASEGLIAGAVQVPPDGRPVVMFADHPTTGGYPVVAVVDPDDLGRFAQHRPGTELRFAWVG
jgi:biotin-dependent carboxylase-like uncharacterized protein